jgi:hypothetical protein
MLIAGENVSGVGTSMSTVINGALSLVQSVFVPTADSEAVQKLRNALGTDRTASRVGVIPDPNAKESYCYQNVQSKVELKGGRMQLGWAVWQHSNLFIEAESHAVFDPGSGKPWIDPTPNWSSSMWLRKVIALKIDAWNQRPKASKSARSLHNSVVRGSEFLWANIAMARAGERS